MEMEKEEIIKYIENPNELNEYSFSELRALLRKYPYFQTAHQLLLLNLKNINDPRFKEFLKQSAVYIKESEKFYRLINDLSVKEEEVQSFERSDDRQKAEGKNSGTTKTKDHSASDSGNKNEDQSGTDLEASGESKEKLKKDKDYSTAYLKQRISDTLSVQKGDSNKKEDLPEDGGDFFILDKASQVEEKMSQRLREKYEQESRKEGSETTNQKAADGSDSFELDSPGKKEEQPGSEDKKTNRNIGGEYFTERDYRETLGNKQQNEDLIDKFIKESPELKNVNPPAESEKKEDISRPSVTENEEMLSEKLANIYIKQGYYNKAISAYKKLSLKYPEKSDYFAKQIEQLRNIINEQQK